MATGHELNKITSQCHRCRRLAPPPLLFKIPPLTFTLTPNNYTALLDKKYAPIIIYFPHFLKCVCSINLYKLLQKSYMAWIYGCINKSPKKILYLDQSLTKSELMRTLEIQNFNFRLCAFSLSS